MASLSDIRTRIGSIQNTKQVTRAMKMVAAAKLRRAQERIFETRPYAFKLREIIDHLQTQLDPSAAHRLFDRREDVAGALVIVVTADRGLAGAFNSNVIKLAEQTIEEHYAAQRERGTLHLICIGRKAHQHFAKRGYQLEDDFQGVFDDLSFNTAQEVARRATRGFMEEAWDEVRLVYNEFKNTISQNRIAEPLLPIPEGLFLTPVMEMEVEDRSSEADEGYGADYIFEPSAEKILEALVPRFLNYQVWRALLESNAAEQGARMIAMDNATSNAEELLEDLQLKYNRARQDAITTEIIEITSGAEALEQG